VDVAIVGGGITGASLLHHLTGRQLRPLLIERFRVASGASGRNAGFLLAGVAANYAQAVELYGRSLAGEVWAFTLDNHALLAEALGGRAGYRRRGSLILAATDEEAELLCASEALLREDGFEARWDAEDRALFNPRDGELDPVAAVERLVGGAPLDSVAEGATVNTIAPVRGQMLASAPEPRRLFSCPVYSHWGYRYWRQLDNGEVLAGGYRDTAAGEEVGYREETTPGIQHRLEQHLRELGSESAVSHRWAGIMGFSPDGLPFAGEVPGWRGVLVCGGYTGHGMAFAYRAARDVAELLAGRTRPPAWLSPARAWPAAPESRQNVAIA
jgi:glycine/D-amino acid oxidase-like deaminating enzyme